MRTFLTLFLANSAVFYHGVNAFFPTKPVTASSPTRSSLFGMMGPEGFFTNEDDGFDIEAIRKRLEALVSSDGEIIEDTPPPPRQRESSPPPTTSMKVPHFYYSPEVDVTLPRAPPMTAIERERREYEIELLSQLEQGDDALSDLWTLWFQERGAAAAARLLQAEELTGQGPKGWEAAESILRALIKEYGVYWAEPVNRLATLFYMQGRFEESETLCKMVLAVKPWHFGALSGIVMVYASMREPAAARQWAARRLPTFAPMGPNRRRVTWAKKAVEDAKQSLLDAEERLREVFGKPDEHRLRLHTDEDNFEEDAWQ